MNEHEVSTCGALLAKLPSRQRIRENPTEVASVTEKPISPERPIKPERLSKKARQVKPSLTKVYLTNKAGALVIAKQESRLFLDKSKKFIR